MNGNFLLNEKFFFFLSSVDCCEKKLKKKDSFNINYNHNNKIFIIPVNFKDLEKRKDEALILSKINI